MVFIFCLSHICQEITVFITLSCCFKNSIQAQRLKTFFMLNSAEHGIYPAQIKNANNIIVGILTFYKCKNANNCWHFTSIKYLPYISLKAIPLLLPIKKTPRMAPPYIDWRDFRMTIVSIVSVTSCQISFLFIAEQRSHKNFKSFVIYKDLCYNFLFLLR